MDEWLTVNATCPTCRKSVFPLEGESLNGEGTTGNPANPATTVPSNTRGDQPHNDTVGSGVATEGPVHQSYLPVFGTSGGQNTATSVSARSSGSAEYNESTPLRANDESNTMTHDR